MSHLNGPRNLSRLEGLDALRGLAAIAVVLHHYTFRYSELVAQHVPALRFVPVNGHFGVNLFFILSGFVIFMSLERAQGIDDFAVSRFARLWPPYLVCMGITASIIALANFNPLQLTVKDALLNVFMVNKALGNVAVDGSYWTLTYEILFYAGAAIAFFILRVRRMEWACLAWLAVAWLARVSGFNEHHLRVGVLLGVDFCHLFVLGMMIYLVWQRRSTWLTLVTVAVAFSMTLFGPYYNPGHMPLWQFVGMTALFALAVWLTAERKLGFLSVGPLVFLGQISYSLYLVHQIAGYWVISRLEQWGWDAHLAILATILLAIAVATGVRLGVEVPAQRAIRQWYRQRFRTQPAPLAEQAASTAA